MNTGSVLFFGGAIVLALLMPWFLTMWRKRSRKAVVRASAVAMFLAAAGTTGFAAMLPTMFPTMQMGLTLFMCCVAGGVIVLVYKVNTHKFF